MVLSWKVENLMVVSLRVSSWMVQSLMVLSLKVYRLDLSLRVMSLRV